MKSISYKLNTILTLVFLLLFMFISELIIAQNKNSHTIIELKVDNDIVFLIDRYYSSGITLNLYASWIEKSPINKILLPDGKYEKSYYSFGITHRMFTPERTLTPEVQPYDRPYATYLLINSNKTSFNSKKRIKKISGFDFGVIGSMAGGQFIQNQLHENISIAQVSKGWHNQIQNDICLQYNVNIEKGIVNLSMFELNGFIGGTLGVPHTEAIIGASTRFGLFDDYFRGISLDISSDISAWLFCSGSLYLVNYNATLQGGSVNQDNVHTWYKINSTLIHGKFGGVLQFNRFYAEYGMEVSSPEFHGAYWHRWAHINLSFAF